MSSQLGGEPRRPPRPPSMLDALVPVLALIGFIALSVYLFGIDATLGPLQVSIMAAMVVAGLIAHGPLVVERGDVQDDEMGMPFRQRAVVEGLLHPAARLEASTTTSTSSSMRCTIRCPSSDFRSIVTDLLPRFTAR